jgi:hypothetical protein
MASLLLGIAFNIFGKTAKAAPLQDPLFYVIRLKAVFA